MQRKQGETHAPSGWWDAAAGLGRLAHPSGSLWAPQVWTVPCTSEARSAEDGTAHWSPEGHHSHTVLSPRAASGEGSDGSDVHCRALGNGHRQGAEGPGLMTSRAEVDRGAVQGSLLQAWTEVYTASHTSHMLRWGLL